MASPSVSHYHGSVTPVAATPIEVATCPFKPRTIKFRINNGGALEVGYKTDEMAGDAYMSTSSGVDAGVTLTDRGFEVAVAADIHIVAAGVKLYFEIMG